MRSVNVAFVLLALTVASQAAPLEETNVPSLQDSRDVYIKKDVIARQEEEETENEGDIPSSTSARNTNDTPSRTTEENLAHLPTSSSHSDPQSGCHCPMLSDRISSAYLTDDEQHHDFQPVRCKCRSPPGPESPTITPAPHRIPGTIIGRDIELEARKFPFKLIWNGFKWVMQEIGDAGGDDPTIQTVDTPKTMIDDSQLGAAASGNASAKF